MIYPTKDCKYDVKVWCYNFREIESKIRNLVTKPTKAKVGQVIQVRAVDGNGSPITFWCVDLPDNESIPKVSEDDNGKFLRVVDGAWAAVTITDVSEVGL